MPHFSSDDKTLLYIIKTTAEDLRAGSWNDYTDIFNSLASHQRTQDGLTGVYRTLNKSEMEARACTSEWEEKREQVRKRLTKVRLVYRS